MSKNKKNEEPKKPLEAAQDAVSDAAETVEDIAEAAEKTADAAAEELTEQLTDSTPESAEEDTAAETETKAEAEASDDAEKKKPAKKKRVRTSEEEAERALEKVKRRKKLKYGTLATIITLVVIAIVVMVNVVINVLDNRYNWNIDLTSSGLYELSEDTVRYLNQLNTDVDVAVMADESFYNSNSKLKVVQETLTRFHEESHGHISIKYIDMTKNPEAVKPYSEHYNGEFSEGDVVLKNGDLVRAVSFDDIIKQEQTMDYTTYQYETKYSFVGEQNLLSAVMGVTDLHPVNVAFIDKMNGSTIYSQNESYCYSRMQELLEKNNFIVTSVDISTDALPEDTDVAILCSPTNDLTDAQVQKLTDFLTNGGKYGKKLMYFASPYQPETPKLAEFLEVWGIAVEQSLMLESNEASAQYVQIAVGGRGVNANSVPLVSATDSKLNAAVVSSKLPIVVPYCRSVKQLFETNSGRTTEALLTSANTAYLYPLDADADFNPDDAEKGTYNAAVLGTQSFSVDGTVVSSDLVVFGSAWFTDYIITNLSSYDNSNYFISLLNTMTGKESIVTVNEKSLDTEVISISESAVSIIRLITMVIIPAIVAIIGIVVYVRRKNK